MTRGMITERTFTQARPEFQAWRKCTTKRRHTSRESAQREADRMNRREDGRKRLRVYECEICFQWHVGGIKE